MKKIPFKVSARTARLIGSENISNPEAALIELVKNSFDADAENCVVIFDNKWLSFLTLVEEKVYNQLEREELAKISKWYNKEGDFYKLILLPDDDNYNELQSYFLNKCSIILMDNGEGMESDVIENQWMTIGTSNKHYNVITKNKNRIKSGAKGIGRFALDKLGIKTEMYTLSQYSEVIYHWTVNWDDFEVSDQTLNNVTATLEEIENPDILDLAKKKFSNVPFDSISNLSFKSGTIIKIDQLRDVWTLKEIENIYNNLEILIPPKEIQDFTIQLYSTLTPEKYGEVSSSYYDDFDYKLDLNFISTKSIKYKIERREFDVKRIPNDVFKETFPKDMSKPPYDRETLKKGFFEHECPIEELWPELSRDLEKKKKLDGLGNFDFKFYFMKLTNKGNERFGSRTFIESKRREWLNRFGGIKIFRDDFRVRPYGERGSNSFDWLGLGERSIQSTFGPGQMAGINWRVGLNQVYGVINISRVNNEDLKDLSNRGGLIENDTFDLFKKFIIKCINLVEKDRHYIIRPISVVNDRINNSDGIKIKALEQSADDLKKVEDSNKGQLEFISINNDSGEKNYTYAKGIQKLTEDIIEKENEIKILRGLASMGLTIATFSHELDEISNKLTYNINKLDEAISKTVDHEFARNLPQKENPYRLIINMKEINQRLENWLHFSNQSVKKDRRKASNISLKEYFNEISETWIDMFNARSSKLSIIGNFENVKLVKAFRIDLDSIFNNLLINSLDAFHEGRSSIRNVLINYTLEKGGIIIHYEDTGPGLSQTIKNPNEIFEPFFSTKQQSIDNYKDGIGLGMWIMKATIDEYNGYVEIIPGSGGFKLNLFFPTIIR